MDSSVKRTNEAPTKSVTRDHSESTKSVRTDYHSEPTKSVTRDYGVVLGAGKSLERDYDVETRMKEVRDRYDNPRKVEYGEKV
jgi:hypothetical protein